LAVTLCVDASAWGLRCGASPVHRLTYHLVHAGLLHWALNASVIATLAFRWQLPPWQWLAAFVIAACYPWPSSVPVVGLSVWIYALLGIVSPVTARPLTFVVFQLSGIALGAGAVWLSGRAVSSANVPIMAWQAHLWGYFAGLCFGLVVQPVWKR
jgi:membrane associated rhomboid family serine protease